MPVPYWAGHYIGLPFQEHGRAQNGLDCWGLVRLVLIERFQITVPSYAAHYRHCRHTTDLDQLIRAQSQNWIEVPPGEEKLGDVVVLRLGGHPVHVGMVMGDGQMLHIQKYINSTIEHYKRPMWRHRIFGFYRYREEKNA